MTNMKYRNETNYVCRAIG